MPRNSTATKKSQKAGQEGDTLFELLLTKLKSLYDVENQLVKALPKMAKNATDPDLKMGFEKHLKQTQEHVARLERAFEMLEKKPQKLAVEGMRGMIADAEWIIKNVNGEEALDASLIAAAQCVENYEMASYQSAVQWANLLEQSDIAELLQRTLDEEEETSDELAELASSKIDEGAMASDGGDNNTGGDRNQQGGAATKGGEETDDAEDEDEEEDAEGDDDNA